VAQGALLFDPLVEPWKTAHHFSVQVVVLSDATASKSEKVQESNLQDMRDAQVTVMRTGEWVEELSEAV
jgi:hypothetical protein